MAKDNGLLAEGIERSGVFTAQDSRRGTREQLDEGTVEVQLAGK